MEITFLQIVYHLVECGKSPGNRQICEFILESLAPAAAKLSHILARPSTKEKERSKDLQEAANYCESMATELPAPASNLEGSAHLLTKILFATTGSAFRGKSITCKT